MNNQESLYLTTIVTICAILLFIPKMLYRPGLILSSLFFIGMANLGLFINWCNKLQKDFVYLGIPFFFIISSLFYCFIVIAKNKEKIQKEDVTVYYYKFMVITLWIICMNLIFSYYLFQTLSKGDTYSAMLNLSLIIFLSTINYFITRFNSLYFIYFSADG